MDIGPCSLLACGYSVHTKPFTSKRELQVYLVRFQSEGCSRIAINEHVQEYRPGDLLVASPGDRYHLQTGYPEIGDAQVSAVRCADYYFTCKIEGEAPFGDYPRKLHIGMDDPFLNLIKNLVYERRKLKDREPDIQDYLIRLTFMYIRRFIQTRLNASGINYLPNKMKDYIERHATEPLTLKQIASHAGLGISRASELFKAAFGISVMGYAAEVKLNMARNFILHETGSMEEVAYSCGFGSYTHFCRMFTKRFGVSPRKYRESNR